MDGITFARQEEQWVNDHLTELAQLHTDLMGEVWDEQWSMEPDGTEERSNSFALWRSYLEQGAHFVSASNGESIAGIGVTVPLTAANIANFEWCQMGQGCFDVLPQDGDFELAMVLVGSKYRNRGIFRRLATMRLAVCVGNAVKPFNFWVQTLEDHPVLKTIREYYTSFEFGVAGRLTIKGTQRLFLTRRAEPGESYG